MHVYKSNGYIRIIIHYIIKPLETDIDLIVTASSKHVYAYAFAHTNTRVCADAHKPTANSLYYYLYMLILSFTFINYLHQLLIILGYHVSLSQRAILNFRIHGKIGMNTVKQII